MDPDQTDTLERLESTPATSEISERDRCAVCGLELVRHCSGGWECPDTSQRHRRRSLALT